MTWDSSRNWSVRGKLARHLGRLQQHLDGVGEQVREAVATAVGRTVAEAVGEAVYDALTPYMAPSGAASRSYSRSADRSAQTRQDWDDPAWRRDAESSSWCDPYAYESDDDDAEAEYRASLRDEPCTRRWWRALAADLQVTQA